MKVSGISPSLNPVKEDNNINFFSRQGQVVEGLADITNDMKMLK